MLTDSQKNNISNRNDAIRVKSCNDDLKRWHFGSRFSFSCSPLHAFTLSEVLITLGIIGVVASFTVPSLIQKGQEQQTVVALKKVYSTLANAYTFAVQENGTPDNWDFGVASSGDGAKNAIAMFTPNLRVIKDCGTAGDCFAKAQYRLLNGDSWGGATGFNAMPQMAKILLADGSAVGFISEGGCINHKGPSKALDKVCGDFYVDVNGVKKPNQFGIDVFQFYLTPYGIIPYGGQDVYNFATYCRDGRGSLGLGCAAWVMYNQNMDYLHCPGVLSWNNQTTCP